jgi:hypothetical protein
MDRRTGTTVFDGRTHTRTHKGWDEMEPLVQFFHWLGVFRLALGLGGFSWRAACFCETTSWSR